MSELIKHQVRLEPMVSYAVRAHAARSARSFSETVNGVLAEALGDTIAQLETTGSVVLTLEQLASPDLRYKRMRNKISRAAGEEIPYPEAEAPAEAVPWDITQEPDYDHELVAQASAEPTEDEVLAAHAELDADSETDSETVGF